MDDQTFAKSSLGVKEETNLEGALGIPCGSGTFHFELRRLAVRAKSLVPTKRNILTVLAGLYDPLGVVSPVAVCIKILFQELCLEEVGWDDEIDGRKKKNGGLSGLRIWKQLVKF